MTALHHIRVRRSRRMPMPLPPKPKARPLSPPTLFSFKGVDIRVRADIERAGWSWDEFLDDLVASRNDDLTYVKGARAMHLVESLVPTADLQAHREDVRRRVKEAHEAEEKAAASIEAEWRAEVAEKGPLGAILDRIRGRPAA